jgi:hypothetical protein
MEGIVAAGLLNVVIVSTTAGPTPAGQLAGGPYEGPGPKIYYSDGAPATPELESLSRKKSISEYGITWTFETGQTIDLGPRTATVRKLDVLPYVKNKYSERFVFVDRRKGTRYRKAGVEKPYPAQLFAFIGYVPNTNFLDAGPDWAGMFITRTDDEVCRGTRWHVRDCPEDPAVDPYFPINQAALSLVPKERNLKAGVRTMTPNSVGMFSKRACLSVRNHVPRRIV